MPDRESDLDLFSAGAAVGAPGILRLLITLDPARSLIRLQWTERRTGTPIAEVRVSYHPSGFGFFYDVLWEVEHAGKKEERRSMHHGTSIHAQLNRLKKQFAVAEEHISACAVVGDQPARRAGAERVEPVALPAGRSPWIWLGRQVASLAATESARFQQRVRAPARPDDPPAVQAARKFEAFRRAFQNPSEPFLLLRITLNFVDPCIELHWTNQRTNTSPADGRIRCTGANELTWELNAAGQRESHRTTTHLNAIRAALDRWRERFFTFDPNIYAQRYELDPKRKQPVYVGEAGFSATDSPWTWLEDEIQVMAEDLCPQFGPLAKAMEHADPLLYAEMQREARRLDRKLQRQEEMLERQREEGRRKQEEKRQREARAAERAKALAAAKTAATGKAPDLRSNLKSQISNLKSPPQRAPLPPVPLRLEVPPLQFQETLLPLADLRGYFLRERAALWWVSNQSDDLLCLPYCRLERLDYQLRTALRVLGPLRGRALLSDEVGLGKTIEAGLVLKELLTRGMVKRFCVLTVPSLVDQWEEELADKFALSVATTNHAVFRSDPERFWRENHALVASLHTLKQPAHLAVAQTVNWDLLIVDEAHYLRNRASQSWQAVNALPRQFLLLLTATPVQNSLEELYNLVTLLQPGQLPSPKEFRARFINPKRPHQPREPEELRRLLGQVMIRNTRANAGVNLPPRRAETVLFAPAEAERAFWEKWESEFRERLAKLSASQASLWGHLLLQAAGSSPAAWREALKSFPDRAAAQAWSEQVPLEASWAKKCDLLVPLSKGEGGVVIFTQFLDTQAAVAERLRAAGVPTFVINGQTPPPQRQPITEDFRKQAGALLLTHSGTEGRNLQFSHRLVNFDLPWNPMEIEQRIGRLHRLGQQQPVRIYNLVQAGTLQEHLLQILQEKLNLFELVVGETGLILGERFSSDEFAEEVFRRWRESEGRVAEALQSLGDELAAARDQYGEVKKLDETLFAKDYESL
ncbi:MAG: DEAD/DEAH box helicase [Verrucomicrobia bacterium]|nr:DEAD/DEAH box helicase [Verrucomicrobiota bacterium]